MAPTTIAPEYRIFKFDDPFGYRPSWIEAIASKNIKKMYAAGGYFIPNPDFDESEPESDENPRLVEHDGDEMVESGGEYYIDGDVNDGPYPIEDLSDVIEEVEEYWDGHNWETRVLSSEFSESAKELTDELGSDFEDRLISVFCSEESRGCYYKLMYDPAHDQWYRHNVTMWQGSFNSYREATDDEIAEAQYHADDEFISDHGSKAFPWINFPLEDIEMSYNSALSHMCEGAESLADVEDAESKVADFLKRHDLEKGTTYTAKYLLSISDCRDLKELVSSLQRKYYGK